MQHPFSVLEPEYNHLLAGMVITRAAAVDEAVLGRKRPMALLAAIDAGRYRAGCAATEVPEVLAAALFEREASTNFSLNPAQGWPLNERSKIIPHNGPFTSWSAAQIAAYKIDGLDKVGKANWSWARACYAAESFNGFGPRNHGRHSGYLYAGSNLYNGGKYVADGVWDPNAVDKQLGVIPLMARIVALRPDLDLPVPFPGSIVVGSPPYVVPPDAKPPAPQPPPEGVHDARALQEALNKLGAHLAVDGSYGRRTRAAVLDFQRAARLRHLDGLAGPETWAAIEMKLAASPRF